jgi:hypothetical protein
MAITIFLMLNGMGIVFLLYVLVNFWREGHRPMYAVREYEMESWEKENSEVIVVTHPISHSAHSGLSVIPIQTRERTPRSLQDHLCYVHETGRTPMKRFSTR